MGRVAVVDTNILLYSINRSSERYAEARELIGSLDKIVLPAIVVYEFIWNLAAAGVSPKEAEKTMTRILLNEKVSLADDRRYLLPAFDLFGNLSLKHYNDSMILAIAKKLEPSRPTTKSLETVPGNLALNCSRRWLNEARGGFVLRRVGQHGLPLLGQEELR